MKYPIDTDWLLDVIAGLPSATQRLDAARPDGLGVSIVSHGELFEGVFGYVDTPVRLAELHTLLAQFETLPFTDPIMESFGRIRSELRRAGRLIPDRDLLIAATAVEHDLILMTRNVRHFARIPGLSLFPA
ncbi:MAG: type II toxin-antitoxin system VapC family toxin [Thermomicrobiales bacterium]|nr:type II toxin-antitoxin system VapC family toxin [Thermomicrobiales bacterium]